MLQNTLYIKLEGLLELCKDNEDRKHKYIIQFLEMIPQSIQKLKFATEKKDRSTIVKELHFMNPQLVFFGIDDYSVLMDKVRKVEGLPFDVLLIEINRGIVRIEKALKEVEWLIKKH